MHPFMRNYRVVHDSSSPHHHVIHFEDDYKHQDCSHAETLALA